MFDLIILGGGPAGFTAGIYGARGGLKTAVVTGTSVGGQISLTHNIENYSGILSIDGFSLANTMREQAESFGAETIYAQAIDLNLDGKVKKVVCDNGETYEARAIIIALGASPRKLGIAREEELIGQGVSYCATCDGGFFRNKVVAVVGGGDTALTDTIYLANICKKVYLIHRRDAFRGAKILENKVCAMDNVELKLKSRVTELVGEPIESIVIESANGNKESLEISGLFIAVGTVANSDLVKDKLSNENGYIVSDEYMRTSVEGVFVAGDVRVTPLRQVITACSDGAIAAESAIKYLFEQ
ncbi:MAG: thioredoxin-disulfide reductase [Clostridia bacterium]|nr:thioredoxin-disulfide reductase [Clostridia bacterium]